MTDQRTARIEAAAAALVEENYPPDTGAWAAAGENLRALYRRRATIAIDAADAADAVPGEGAADLLDQYGQALRDSWADIDGRSEKLALLQLSAAIREHGNKPLPRDKVHILRDSLGVCPGGGGHWYGYCKDSWTVCETDGAGR